jgi:hypothetical protein
LISRIRSSGAGQLLQPDRLGVFSASDVKRHGRVVYKQDFGGKNYLFYWDWGPNNGANWIVGFNPGGLNFNPYFFNLIIFSESSSLKDQ